MTQSDIGIVELKACPLSKLRNLVRCGERSTPPWPGDYRLFITLDDARTLLDLWNTRAPIITEMVEALEDIKAAALRNNGPLARDHDADTLRTIGKFIDTMLAKVRSK